MPPVVQLCPTVGMQLQVLLMMHIDIMAMEWQSNAKSTTCILIVSTVASLQYLFWDVWAPSDGIRICWDLWMLVLLAYVIVLVPYIIAFNINTVGS
jgi:hypothetical protein